MTFEVGSVTMPTVGAFHVVFWCAGAAALVAAMVGVFIPRHGRGSCRAGNHGKPGIDIEARRKVGPDELLDRRIVSE
jgi:hypothetical protein